MRSADVTVLICLQLHPDFVEQGKSELSELARVVRKEEPDCSMIEMAQDIADSTKITMIEKWSSRESYEGPHMQTQHMKSFIDRASKFFVGPPDISCWRGTVID